MTETDYREYSEQILNVSVVYNVYRIILPLILLVTYLSSRESSLLGVLDPTLFIQINILFAIYALVITFFVPSSRNWLQSQTVLTGMLIGDILVMALLIYASAGMISGLGLLMIVTVAAGSIMIRGRISTFLAAVATLLVIYTEVYLSLLIEEAPNQFIQTGILGIILFVTSYYVQLFSNRIITATELAERQAAELIDLEKLNNEIIQRMRTGVLVVDSDHHIVTLNATARRDIRELLGDQSGTEVTSANRVPHLIEEQLTLWNLHPGRQPQSITLPDSRKQLQLSFAFLNSEPDSSIVIFLEDNRQLIQRVRQMKLASLGRLTASIAHEVRNPLGAISHASQLLKESDSVIPEDQRMIDIILSHCDRINTIIEDVLDASRQDESPASKIELSQWLERFIDQYRASHELCDEITLQINEEVTIYIIATQLEQVLNNLFDNGLRYSQKHTGRASLYVEIGIQHQSDDAQPYLHVIDDGPGVATEARASLFEPFNTTETKGTGLGLYLSRELCEANQARLSYKRSKHGGSCFSIYFSPPDRNVI